MHQGASDIVIHPDVIGCEHKDVICHGTNLKVKNAVELVDLF